MTGRTRKTFTPEFRLKASQLVVDQGYRAQEAADAMNVKNQRCNNPCFGPEYLNTRG
jgi:transposase-like protein